MKTRLSAKQTLIVTVAVTLLMAVGHTVVECLRFGGDAQPFDLLMFCTMDYAAPFPSYEAALCQLLFNLEFEANFPTLWSAMLLLSASALLARLSWRIHQEKGRYLLHWSVLSLAFLYLSLDEWFELHEMAMGPMQRFTPDVGVFYYSWIIPAGIMAAGMGIVYIKFLLHLPRRTAVLFVLSGAVYVGSAIGFEMVEGPLERAGEWMGLAYSVCVGLEEVMEMLGICLFSYAIVDYAEGRPAAEPPAEGATADKTGTEDCHAAC